MGKSSKPLNIHLDKSLYDTDKLAWDALAEQGFVLTIVEGEVVDIYFAPHAMRMTSHMLMNMPSARDLAIKGARALRYAPHGTTPTKGKTKGATKAKPHKGRNAKVKAEVVDTPTATSSTGEPAVTTEDSRTGRGTLNTLSGTADNERII